MTCILSLKAHIHAGIFYASSLKHIARIVVQDDEYNAIGEEAVQLVFHDEDSRYNEESSPVRENVAYGAKLRR